MPAVAVLLAAAAVLLTALLLLDSRSRNKGFPGPRHWPIVGQALVLRDHARDFPLVLEEWADVYGGLFAIRVFTRNVVIVTDAAVAKRMLSRRPTEFYRVAGLTAIAKETGSAGVFSAEGHEWKVQRKLTSPAFRTNVINGLYREHVALVTRRLRSRWLRLIDEGNSVAMIDVRTELMSYTLDLISLIGFGYDVNSLETDDQLVQSLMAYMPVVQHRVGSLVPYWRYFETAADKRFRGHQMKVKEALERILENYRSEDTGDGRDRSLLQSLMRAQAQEKERLSDAELFGNCVTFLLAGNDTNANTMAWMMYFLGSEEGVLSRARHEADKHMREAIDARTAGGEFDSGTADGGEEYEEIGIPGSSAAVGKLGYCAGVFHEALRTHGPAGVIFATNFNDIPVKSLVREGDFEDGRPRPWYADTDATIKGETLNILMVRKMCLQEKNFSRPLDFMPERWMEEERPEGFNHNAVNSFFHFGSGARVCPGRSLAQLEATTFCAMVATNFDVEVPAEYVGKVSEFMDFTIRPTRFLVKISRRAA